MKLATIGFVLCGLLGCGQGPELVEVTGRLHIAGTPLANVRIEFLPEAATASDRDLPASNGVTDDEGRFRLATHEGMAGAIVGEHRVILNDLAAAGTATNKEQEDQVIATPLPAPRFSGDFRIAAKTPLRATITGSQPSIEIDLAEVK